MTIKWKKQKKESYSFQNIYLITTYQCNWKCSFCLFRFNKEKEAPIDFIIKQLQYSIEDSKQRIYLKITGGEPFIRTDLMEEVFKLTNLYSGKVYKIGIGTNGSIGLPKYFDAIKTRTHIFLSRHQVLDDLPTPCELKKNISNPLIDFRINCNLVKGGVDSLTAIKEYVAEKFYTIGITHFCFRELSKVNIDANLFYPKEIYQYIDYYKKYLIPVEEIEKQIKNDNNFDYSRNTGNTYDSNHWYWYNLDGQKISIKFRTINEMKLIQFNKKHSDIDEYVIHPDGTLTGCWDKQLKVIRKGVN